MHELMPGQVSEGWDSASVAYGKLAMPVTSQFADEVFRRLNLVAGEQVLDIAAGTGAASIAAAKLGAEVTAIDFSAGMVSELRRRCASAGYPDVKATVMDGQALDLEEDTFDIGVSCFGLTFFPDLGRGFSELHRVLKPSGRAAVLADTLPADDGFSRLFGQALVQVIPDFGADDAGSIPPHQRLAQPGAMENHLSKAGFHHVRVDSLTMQWLIPDLEAIWGLLGDGLPHVKPLFDALGPETSAKVGRAFTALVQTNSESGAPSLETSAVIGIGVK